jgi:phage terminase large subunit
MIVVNDGVVEIETAAVFEPLLSDKTYLGAKGGRGSGKSHFFGERVVEEMVFDPTLSVVCIREVQKSLKFSAKRLIENKIHAMGVSHMFQILENEIRRRPVHGMSKAPGVCIFQGLQDHTADSIKSLEDFRLVWVEEAQSISKRSMDLMIPTFREGARLWFSWNPDQPDDPVEKLFESLGPDEAACVHANYLDNPMCPEKTKKDAERCRINSPDDYDHIWLGAFNVKRDAIILNGKYRIEEFEPGWDWEPLHGLDWGFANDPTAAVRAYLVDDTLYVRSEVGGVGVELDDTPKLVKNGIMNAEQYVIRADNARPESISYCKRHGLPMIRAVDKWPGSVEDGIAWLRSLNGIVIHPDCRETAQEARLYQYKVHKQTDEILPQVLDKNNHYIDAIRYACAPIIRNTTSDYGELI